jgi:hypothetical protein
LSERPSASREAAAAALLDTVFLVSEVSQIGSVLFHFAFAVADGSASFNPRHCLRVV